MTGDELAAELEARGFQHAPVPEAILAAAQAIPQVWEMAQIKAERDRYREALETIAADTLDHEPAETALAWRVKLAHEALP